VAEVRVDGAGGDDQCVVPQHELVLGNGPDRPLLDVDSRDLRQEDLDRGPPAKEAAQRGRDLAGREDPRRDLVEEGLEEVVVGAVDERDVDREPAQGLRRPQAAEAAADDDDALAPAFRRRCRQPLEPERRNATRSPTCLSLSDVNAGITPFG
jgi:hypothetical protein